MANLFLSTPSARRATAIAEDDGEWEKISIHALREEGDRLRGFFRSPAWDFYPRPPRGGRPDTGLRGVPQGVISIHALREEGDSRQTSKPSRPHYFYPRPPRGGRLRVYSKAQTAGTISIHALREEGDVLCVFLRVFRAISIHALREEGDRAAARRPKAGNQFLSTPSARRATVARPPSSPQLSISIHALREEGDADCKDRRNRPEISIHALREEGDLRCYSSPVSSPNFYPRPPRGGRLYLSYP